MITSDIVIIDSGVYFDKEKSEKPEKGLRISVRDGIVEVDENFQDEMGHGTAVFSIIRKFSPDSEILNIKLFDENGEVSEEGLFESLKYIRDNVNCKVVNLSCGIKYCNHEKELEEICIELQKKGIIIISAFDNDGCCSFPAAFKNVIGVDANYQCKGAFDFEYVEGDLVNIRAKGGIQRVKWKDGKTIVLGGSSFACAYVTAYAANLLLSIKKNLTVDEILSEFRKHSDKIFINDHFENKNSGVNCELSVKSAAIFPFNKEMHSLIRFSDYLKFNIDSVYDVRQLGRTGTKTNRILNLSDKKNNFVIKDIGNIDYDNIDWMILGHLEEVNRILKRDIRKEMVLSCIQNNINIYSYDSLEYCKELFMEKECKVFWPAVYSNDVPQNTFGKLYGITKPVIGVFGTASKQGKFTLQITLKKLLEDLDYHVGTIGTEPQALLFGMDYVYPMGYNSAIYINEHESVMLLNEIMYKLCNKSDLIMVGSQANTIPYNFLNTSSYHTKQNSFLLGTQPDAVILCVNPKDDIRYIKNTIKYIEGLTDSKVIGIVVFPMKESDDWRGMFDARTKISDEEYETLSLEIETAFNIKAYKLGEISDITVLRDDIIQYFS